MKPRTTQRGTPLKDFCCKAKTTTHEYGEKDDRIFCYGIQDAMSDTYFTECAFCGAFVENAKPLEGYEF